MTLQRVYFFLLFVHDTSCRDTNSGCWIHFSSSMISLRLIPGGDAACDFAGRLLGDTCKVFGAAVQDPCCDSVGRLSLDEGIDTGSESSLAAGS